MLRTEIIQSIIDKKEYKTYLEIGVCDGINFHNIKCDKKVGVDPDPNSVNTTHYITSDKYFEEFEEPFDIIFIDGLHHDYQVYKDINNALNILNEGGTIVCHDMSPTSELIQRVPRESKVWTGNCWRAWIQLRRTRNDLNMFVIDTDWGVGIIQKGKQTTLKVIEGITYENLDINRNKWLNLKTVKGFKKWLTGQTSLVSVEQ